MEVSKPPCLGEPPRAPRGAREDSTYAVPRLLLGATGQWIAEFRGRFTSNAPVNGVTCIRRYDDFLLLI